MSLDITNGTASCFPTGVAILSPGDVAIREADHRIANSFQLLASVLGSQDREVTDASARNALQLTIRRIEAVAAVHRQLYLSAQAGKVEIENYLEDLVAALQASFGSETQNRTIRLKTQRWTVPHDFAITLGMIVTELVINACKYAYDPNEPGDVEVRFTIPHSSGPSFSLCVEDRGSGSGVQPRLGGFGGRMLEAMSRKLGAIGGYQSGEIGTLFAITGNMPRD